MAGLGSAAASCDGAVQSLLAQRQIFVMNGDAATVSAVDAALADDWGVAV